MVFFNSTKNYYLSLLLLLSITTVLASADIEGCIFNNGKGCTRCYKRAPIYPSQSCGAPLTNNCLISSYDRENPKFNFCSQCEEGFTRYILNKNGHPVTECRKGGPLNCISSVRENSLSFDICAGCKAGYYSVIRTAPLGNSCVPLKDLKVKPVENCEEGGILTTGGAKCFRCQEGFTRDVLGTECLKETVPGCSVASFTDESKCTECDYSNGYFMNEDGDCVKIGSLVE